MLIKTLVVILFLFAVISLFVGLFFLLKDDANASNKRTMFALMTRVGFCAIALAILAISVLTGKLNMNPSPEKIDQIAEEARQSQATQPSPEPSKDSR
ncbi:conserved hypothetical protein [gamma proteobacterium HTCC5015]|nr:conserved hypothetical protein [gamma proteobacterium HTCC5015]